MSVGKKKRDIKQSKGNKKQSVRGQLTGSYQMDLFLDRGEFPVKGEKPKRERKCGFVYPNVDEVMLGDHKLEDILRDRGLSFIIEMKKILMEMDWSEFEACTLSGRPPIAPMLMMGLIMVQ